MLKFCAGKLMIVMSYQYINLHKNREMLILSKRPLSGNYINELIIVNRQKKFLSIISEQKKKTNAIDPHTKIKIPQKNQITRSYSKTITKIFGAIVVNSNSKIKKKFTFRSHNKYKNSFLSPQQSQHHNVNTKL